MNSRIATTTAAVVSCAICDVAPARSRHRRLRRAAVDDECAAHGGRGVRRRQSENVRVLVEALAMALREYARRRGALRDDDREARGGNRQQRAQLVHRRHREPQRREAPGYRADDVDAATREVVRAARRDPAMTAMSGTGRRGSDCPASEDRGDDEPDTASVGRWISARRPTSSRSCVDGAVGRHGDAEHLAEHGDADLDADACEEPDEHGPRQEIGEEPEPEKPRKQKERGGEQRERADERHVPLAARRGHFGKARWRRSPRSPNRPPRPGAATTRRSRTPPRGSISV